LRETAGLVGNLDALLRQLRERFTEAPKEVRVGVAQSISVAYLPGFFAAQQKRQPGVRLKITHQPSGSLLARLEANEVDVAILTPPKRLPSSLRASHRFRDAFALVLPSNATLPAPDLRHRPAQWTKWLRAQPWLLLHESANTGARLHAWLKKRAWLGERVTDLDSFDLIISLVALGQGVSLVPLRALAIYRRQRKLQVLTMPDRFEREIVVLTRKRPALAGHVGDFVENILF
jgi:DNA-binding transcriptional LysR family regulator